MTVYAKEVHVTPDHDRYQHNTDTTDCPCEPQIAEGVMHGGYTVGTLIVHRPLDNKGDTP